MLDVRVRRWIWEQKWTELRDIQEAAVEPILAGDRDVILAAATASGKTEAAFLPICSRLANTIEEGVQAVYVSPLKALINDQHDRLEQLCAHLGIHVHRWHGDVASSAKRRLMDRPSGILLITPESLEALFVIHGTRIPLLFRALHYVVVDELHVFIGSERGRQLQSLLHRLELSLGRSVPRIALSATLGDMKLASAFLRSNGDKQVSVISSDAEGQELKLQVRGYVRRTTAPPAHAGDAAPKAAREDPETIPNDVRQVTHHLYATLRGTDNLIFANSRASVEQYADLLRQSCEEAHVPNEFWPHHGSLSKGLREDVEALLKERSRPVTVVCTTTLELGIDIGSVSSIAQIGAPPSVSSLRQRLGRSGRRGGPAVLRLYVQEAELGALSSPEDLLREDLIQCIAMIRLLLAHWYEPPLHGALHLSTLVQQILSVIAQHGGVAPLRAWRILCKSGPFEAIDEPRMARLLRSLEARGLIRRSGDGTLFLDTLGERIVGHHSFYAAFATPEEYRLTASGQVLGTLPISFPVMTGLHLVFAGRRWRVLLVDDEKKVIDLAPAKGGRLPVFGGRGGWVHDEVRRQMLHVYCGTDMPAYLDAGAQSLLTEARQNFSRFGLAERSMVRDGDDTHLFLWAGDRAVQTVAIQLRAHGLCCAPAGGLVLHLEDADEQWVRACLGEILSSGPANAGQIAKDVENKRAEKYDHFLDDELLTEDFALRNLDPRGALVAIERALDLSLRLSWCTGVAGDQS